VLGLNDLVFHSREEFHNYIGQFEGYSVPESVLIPKKEPEQIWINGMAK